MKRAWIVAAAAAALLISGCDSGPETLKFGVAGPMTESDAAFGAQLRNGAQQAILDINAAGGINGEQVELLVGDDAGFPQQGVSVANSFVGDGVKFVVGHFNSGVTIPATSVYAENNILVITPGSTNPAVTDRGLWNVFRTCGRDDQQGAVAADYIATKLAGKKVAIVHDKTTYGKGLADETKKALNSRGITEVLYEGVNAREKDYSALVSKVKESGAEVFYWGGVHTEGGLILRQLRDQGVQAIFMGGDGIATDEFGAIAGAAAEGTLMTFGPDPKKRPEAQEVLKRFAERNVNPESYTLYSYAAVQVIAQAAKAANSLDPKVVAKQIKSGQTFDTVIGNITYNEKGDINRTDYVIYVWKKQPDGKVTFVQQ
jgi:branched-chain amino acid transport system substrate-binding protein